MSANDEYFAMLARLMVQSAEAKRNKEQDEEDRIFRRQQAADALALQRENLALDRQRTEAQIATESERRAGMESDRKRAERNDTVASIDEQMYQMEYGENPTQTKMRLGRRKEEAGVAAAESQASILAAEAEDTPSKIAMGRRKDEAALKASEAQMRAAERGDLRDEEKYRREVDRQEQDDAEIEAAATLADNPDAMLGVKPLSESVGGKVKLRALGMRANKAKTEDEIAAAAEAPMERKQGRKLKASQIAAAEEQTAAYKQQREDALLRRDHEARMRDLLETESRQRIEANAVDLGTKRREAEQSMRDMVARRLGLRTDAEQAGAREFFDKMRIQGLFEAANRAATTSLDGTTFNNDIYTTQVAKIQSAMELAGNLGALSKRDPNKFKELKAEAADVMMKILESGGSPSVALDSVGKLVGAVVKATKPPPPPPSDVVPKTAYGRALKARTEKASDVAKKKGSDLVAILEGDADLAARAEEAVRILKRNRDTEGKEHPVTDEMVKEMVLDYVGSDGTITEADIRKAIAYAQRYRYSQSGKLKVSAK